MKKILVLITLIAFFHVAALAETQGRIRRIPEGVLYCKKFKVGDSYLQEVWLETPNKIVTLNALAKGRLYTSENARYDNKIVIPGDDSEEYSQKYEQLSLDALNLCKNQY